MKVDVYLSRDIYRELSRRLSSLHVRKISGGWIFKFKIDQLYNAELNFESFYGRVVYRKYFGK